MAKIDITRTELVWPGKYNEDGTRREVERVNVSSPWSRGLEAYRRSAPWQYPLI